MSEKPGFRAAYLARARFTCCEARTSRRLENLNLFLTHGQGKELLGREGHEQRGRLLLGLVARLPLEARKKPRALTQGELREGRGSGGRGRSAR